MNKCKQWQEKERQLSEELQEADLVFQNDHSKENLVALNVLRESMEKGEQGKNNFIYFLNLEKGNHIKKQLSLSHQIFLKFYIPKRSLIKVCFNHNRVQQDGALNMKI